MFTETHEIMKNGHQCMSRTRYYEWFKRFTDGRQSTHDELRLGRPSTSCDDVHVAQDREIMRSNRRFTVQKTVKQCNITSDTESERRSVCHLSGTFGSR
jgi:hypothetical protein